MRDMEPRVTARDIAAVWPCTSLMAPMPVAEWTDKVDPAPPAPVRPKPAGGIGVWIVLLLVRLRRPFAGARRPAPAGRM